MDTFLIVLIVVIVLITLVSGLRAIIITWQNCVALGSTDGFFSDIWSGTGGNIIVILGLLLLCVPVYILLNIVISLKKRKLLYRVQTRYVAKECYRKALDDIKNRLAVGEDPDKVHEEVVNQLMLAHEPREEAEESVVLFILLLRLGTEEKLIKDNGKGK